MPLAPVSLGLHLRYIFVLFLKYKYIPLDLFTYSRFKKPCHVRSFFNFWSAAVLRRSTIHVSCLYMFIGCHFRVWPFSIWLFILVFVSLPCLSSICVSLLMPPHPRTPPPPYQLNLPMIHFLRLWHLLRHCRCHCTCRHTCPATSSSPITHRTHETVQKSCLGYTPSKEGCRAQSEK